MNAKQLEGFIALAHTDVSYNADLKAQFRREATKVLRALAEKLGYNNSQYDLTYNAGGIAVSGDVTLHSDRLYVDFSQSGLGPDMGFMWRECHGRRDYVGGVNRWTKWEELRDLDAVARQMKAEAGLA